MDSDNAGRIAATLRVARARRGITQEQLATLSTLAPQTISRFERGRREPRVSQLMRIAAALGTTPSELLAGVEAAA
ncbi:XRE family transcriptional regulator [Nocardia panacis]|uniref:XRE family transcriptional regulator n=1 Tax=Nocardia panacis TaxID=2340916 RepID=A0A3A4JVA9_9NOCA|nr:helix-turn-helix transcriptional regulator [Nocardia panacis]RJO74133.1 XRE family transcriptional regulator [Nocardia panacis]